jgi:dTMP kinase
LTRFITLEGGEGAGKSTQAHRLAAWLAGRGQPTLLTREPGGAPAAEVLRDLLLGGKVSFHAQTEVLLHFAVRTEHIERTIRPALAAGMWVICDRFADSTMVYQGHALGADRAKIATLTEMIGLRPDLTLVLDVPVATTQARLAARGTVADRYEKLGEGFFAAVRQGFLGIAAAEPGRCALIDVTPGEDAVAAAMIAAVQARLGAP